MNNTQLGLAFVWKRQGKAPQPAATWAHVISLELGWMSPGEAKRFVVAAIEAGLLIDADGGLRPATTGSGDLPRGFQLDPAVEPPAKSEDPFMQWVEDIAAASNTDASSVLARMAERQDAHGGLLDAEAALLQLAAEAGLDVRERAAAAVKAMQGK